MIAVTEERFIVGRDLLLHFATLRRADEELLRLAVLRWAAVLQGRHARALIPHAQSTAFHQG